MNEASLAALYPSATPVSSAAPAPAPANAPAAPTAAPNAAPGTAPAPTPAAFIEQSAAPARDDAERQPSEADGAVEPVEVAVPKSYTQVRWIGEPPATSTNDFNSFVINDQSQGPLTIEDPVMHQQALDAMQAAGFGMTMGRLAYDFAKDAALNPVRTDRATAEAQLREAWGSRFDTNRAAVMTLVDQAEKAWPGVRAYLDTSGLGNNVGFLMAIARKATGDKQFTNTKGSK